jgi:hypothetical protein
MTKRYALLQEATVFRRHTLNSVNGARSQRGQEQFVRVGPCVAAAVLGRLARLEHMMGDRDVLDKSHRSGSYVYASRHIPP